MKIRDITWSNYRRLPDGQLSVRDHLVLVGPNDTGKSSIVRVLHICLGMAHGQVTAAVTPRDFTGVLLEAGLRLEPTGRNPRHFTIAFDDLDEGVSRLCSCEHQVRVNPYHEE